MKEESPLSEVSENHFSDAERQQFYKEHFAELAENHNKKWLTRIKEFLGLSETLNDYDIARQIAEEESVEFDARHSEEFEHWEKGLERVLEELRFVRDNREEANRRGIRPMLFVAGGGMKGPYCAAQVVALHDAGYGNVFKDVIGVSAGSGPAAYFVAGAEQSRNATSLFAHECCVEGREGLISFSRGMKVIDTSMIAANMRDGEKFLDQDKIQASDVGLHVLATNVDTGEVDVIDMKSATREGVSDMVGACEASSAIPLFTERFEVNGRHYIDGSVGELPLDKIIQRFKPTSILVLPNSPFSGLDLSENTSIENIIEKVATMYGKEGSLRPVSLNAKPKPSITVSLAQTLVMSQNGSKAMGMMKKMIVDSINDVLSIKNETRHTLEDFEEKSGVKIGVLWSTRSGLGNLTSHAGVVRGAIMDTYHDTFVQLGEKEPNLVKYWN